MNCYLKKLLSITLAFQLVFVAFAPIRGVADNTPYANNFLHPFTLIVERQKIESLFEAMAQQTSLKKSLPTLSTDSVNATLVKLHKTNMEITKSIETLFWYVDSRDEISELALSLLADVISSHKKYELVPRLKEKFEKRFFSCRNLGSCLSTIQKLAAFAEVLPKETEEKAVHLENMFALAGGDEAVHLIYRVRSVGVNATFYKNIEETDFLAPRLKNADKIKESLNTLDEQFRMLSNKELPLPKDLPNAISKDLDSNLHLANGHTHLGNKAISLYVEKLQSNEDWFEKQHDPLVVASMISRFKKWELHLPTRHRWIPILKTHLKLAKTETEKKLLLETLNIISHQVKKVDEVLLTKLTNLNFPPAVAISLLKNEEKLKENGMRGVAFELNELSKEQEKINLSKNLDREEFIYFVDRLAAKWISLSCYATLPEGTSRKNTQTPFTGEKVFSLSDICNDNRFITFEAKAIKKLESWRVSENEIAENEMRFVTIISWMSFVVVCLATDGIFGAMSGSVAAAIATLSPLPAIARISIGEVLKLGVAISKFWIFSKSQLLITWAVTSAAAGKQLFSPFFGDNTMQASLDLLGGGILFYFLPYFSTFTQQTMNFLTAKNAIFRNSVFHNLTQMMIMTNLFLKYDDLENSIRNKVDVYLFDGDREIHVGHPYDVLTMILIFEGLSKYGYLRGIGYRRAIR